MPSIDAIATRLNPVVVALLRSPLHWLLSFGLALITVTGRRTGRSHTFPVGFQRYGDEIVILASEAAKKNWWRNFHEPSAMKLVVRGVELEGTARLVRPDSEEFFERLARAFTRMRGLGRGFGVAFDRENGFDEDARAALRRNAAVVHVTLTPGSD